MIMNLDELADIHSDQKEILLTKVQWDFSRQYFYQKFGPLPSVGRPTTTNLIKMKNSMITVQRTKGLVDRRFETVL